MSKKNTIEDRLIEVTKDKLKYSKFSDLTIRDICKEANCSTATFYQYFESKNDLLLALFVYDAQEMQKTNISDFTEGCPLQAILELTVYSAKAFCSLGPDVLKHFLTPSNTAIDINFFGKTKRGNWLASESNRQLDLILENEIFVSDRDVFDFRKELDVIFFGYIFHWSMADGSYDIEKRIRKMLIRYMNMFAKEENKLPLDA